MTLWQALGAIVLFLAALVFTHWRTYRAGGRDMRARVAELEALVKLWRGRAERAQAGKHRRPETVAVQAKTALPPWTPTLTVVRMPQPVTHPGPDTIAMSAVTTTGGMRALTDDYIAEIEARGAVYREGLTAS